MLSYPLAFSQFTDLIRSDSFDLVLDHFQDSSAASDNEWSVSEATTAGWRAEIGMAPITNDIADIIKSRIWALTEVGSSGGFYLYNIRRPGLRSDPTGSSSSSLAAKINSISDRRNISLNGLLANTTKLQPGDFITVGYSGRYQLCMVCETVTANGLGITPVFSIVPALRVDIVVGNSVTLYKPRVKMMIRPGGFDPGSPGLTVTTGMSLSCVEVR